MKKLIIAALILLLCSPVFAWEESAYNITTDTSEFDTNLSSTDINVQTALETLDELVAGAGTGDIISVGDAASGAAFDGTSDGGTYLDFYDAQGRTRLIGGNTVGEVNITLPNTTGTLLHTEVDPTVNTSAEIVAIIGAGVYEGDLANSAGLAAALSNETGTELAVFSTSPTITTPDILGMTWGTDKFVVCNTFTSAGINAAIDTLSTEGGEVYLPEGDYDCTASITIDYANTTLRGAGKGTRLLATNRFIFDAATELNGIVAGETITGTTGGRTYTAVVEKITYDTASAGTVWYHSLSNAANYQDNDVIGHGAHTVTIAGTPTEQSFNAIDTNDKSCIIISDLCIVGGSGGGNTFNLIGDGDNADNLKVSNCYFYESDQYDIYTAGDWVNVSHNYFDGSDADSIWFHNGTHCIADSNIIKNGRTGIDLYVSPNCTISNNTIDAVSNFGIIVDTNSHYANISGNIIDGANTGIQIGATNCIVDGNTVLTVNNPSTSIKVIQDFNIITNNNINGKNVTDKGIWLDEADYCVVTGNFTTGHDVSGIQEDSDCQNNLIYGNNCQDSTPYVLNGTAPENLRLTGDLIADVTGALTGNADTATTAANLSGTPALPNGTTATTQAAADNSTKLATTAYADAAAGGGGAATSLNNLASVAINTSLVSDTADTDDLGSTTKEWANVYVGDVGKIYLGIGQDVSINRSAANEMTLVATSGVTVESVKMDGGVVTGATLAAANNVIEADTVTNATLTTALTVNTGTLTLTANVANNSVLTVGAGASSVSGANTGDNSANSTYTIGSATQAYDADLTTWAGITPGANVGTFLGTPSSANLLAAITDETGTGTAVFNNSPTFADDIQLGLAGATGILKLYSEQGATDYTASLYPNAAMTSAASFYLPADEPAAQSFLSMSTGGVMSFVAPNAGTNIANDLEEEVTEGSLADSTIVSADIKDGEIAGGDINAVLDLGGKTSVEIPNGANPTCDAAGEIAVNSTDKTLEFHDGTRQSAIPVIKTIIVVLDAAADYDFGPAGHEIPFKDLDADAFPHGIYITKIYVDCSAADPTTELDADIMYCDATTGAFPGANATVIKAVDTTTGNFSDAAVNTAVAVGKSLYIKLNADPTDANTTYKFKILYYIPTA